MNVATLSYVLLWIVASEYAAVGAACLVDRKWPLALVFFAFSLSNVGLAMVGAQK